MNLLCHHLVKPRHASFDVKPETLARQPLRAYVARKQQLVRRHQHAHNLGVRRQRLAIKVMNLGPARRVGFDQLLRGPFKLRVHLRKKNFRF